MSVSLKQSFELGTATQTVSLGNSGGTGVNAFNIVNIGASSAIIYDTAHSAHGSQACKFTAGSTDPANIRWNGLNSSACSVSFYVYFTATPGADLFLSGFLAGGPSVLRVMFSSSTGKLQLIDTRGTGSFIWRSAAPMPLNQWIRIEMFCTIGAGTATATVAYYSLDSTSAIDGTTVNNANTGTTAIDTVSFGKTDTSTYNTPFWMDDFQVDASATGLIGPWSTTATSPVRPTTIISNAGAWTVVGAADIISALADESDSSYAATPANPAAAVLEVKVGNLSTGGTISAIARHGASASTPAITRTYYVVEGSTIRHTEAGVVLPTSPTNYTVTLTTTESNAVVDRSDLRLRVSDTV